jgi:hypothetical protein
MKFFFIVIGMLAATSCHRAPNPTPADAGTMIDCALGSNAKLAHECAVERAVSADGDLILILHHPDGGFRQLLVTRDGRGVVAADGSSEAAVTPLDGHEIDVMVDQDRYHLPATVKGGR